MRTMLRLDERKQHLGRGLVAMLMGLVLLVVGILVTGPSSPASTAGQAVVVSIGIALALVGALLIVIGVAKAGITGRKQTWSRATLGAVLFVSALLLGFAVFPSWWLRAMRNLGPTWAKDLVSLAYVAAIFAAGGYLLKGPVETMPRVSGVSAYGRTLVKGDGSGR